MSLLLVAVAIDRLRRRPSAVLVAVAAILWPVAHIGDVEALAVAVNVLLVLGFGGLVVATSRR